MNINMHLKVKNKISSENRAKKKLKYAVCNIICICVVHVRN